MDGSKLHVGFMQFNRQIKYSLLRLTFDCMRVTAYKLRSLFFGIFSYFSRETKESDVLEVSSETSAKQGCHKKCGFVSVSWQLLRPSEHCQLFDEACFCHKPCILFAGRPLGCSVHYYCCISTVFNFSNWTAAAPFSSKLRTLTWFPTQSSSQTLLTATVIT